MDPRFASDNAAGVHPDILESICRANTGAALAYGSDEYTERATDKVKAHFGKNAEAFFVYNGTAANVLCIAACTSPFNSVVCTDIAHMTEHECGAPERFTGCKLIPLHSQNGKLSLKAVSEYVEQDRDEHYVQPAVISITQATETGTIYTREETAEIADCAHEHGMYVHVDGARLANAAAALNCPLSAVVQGADAVSFGGTKNGMMFGEAVVILNSACSENFKYIRKQGMQLHSKMRFIAAQFETYLSDDLWLKNAVHANSMASLLAEKLKAIPEIEIAYPVQTNGVFASVPAEIIPPLQQEYFVHVWDASRSEIRIMTAFNTEEEDIASLVSTIKQCVAAMGS